jgi:hypothetical protein
MALDEADRAQQKGLLADRAPRRAENVGSVPAPAGMVPCSLTTEAATAALPPPLQLAEAKVC